MIFNINIFVNYSPTFKLRTVLIHAFVVFIIILILLSVLIGILIITA